MVSEAKRELEILGGGCELVTHSVGHELSEEFFFRDAMGLGRRQLAQLHGTSRLWRQLDLQTGGGQLPGGRLSGVWPSHHHGADAREL